jgi:SSS family solute:Na+ symporter
MTKAQFWLLFWTAIAAVVSGLVAHLTGSGFGYGLGAIIGIIILCSILIYQGALNSGATTQSEEYFGARSHLSAQSTLQSLGTTWIMLGNVVVANMVLGQTFGLITFWVIITWAWAFILASYRVPRIRECLSAGDTLHSFLHETYGSYSMRLVAAFITVFVGIGVFGVELVAGASLLAAILPPDLGKYIVPILLILIVMVMAGAAIMGGLRSVIASDSTFYYVIMGSLFLLAVITLVPWVVPNAGIPKATAVWWPNLGTFDVAVFLIGIFALQVPLLLGDFGTWQRIKATNLAETDRLSSLTARQSVAQSYLWGVPVIAGIVIATAPKIGESWTGNLYPSSAPLIEIVRTWIESDAINPFVKAMILTAAVTGLLAVMITTANSYLMISMEAWVHDFHPTSRETPEAFDQPIPRDVQLARILCIMFALLGLIPVAIIVGAQINLLSVVLSVFAVQVALAPAAVLALHFPAAAKNLSKLVIGSTILAFATAFIFGIIVAYGVTDDWWVNYGAYLAPVIALGVPTIAIAGALIILDGATARSRAFLWKLFIPAE